MRVFPVPPKEKEQGVVADDHGRGGHAHVARSYIRAGIFGGRRFLIIRWQERTERALMKPGEGLKLDDVHPALSRLAPGHLGLRLTHGLGDVVLGQSSVLPGCPEAPEEGPVLRRVNGRQL